MLRRYGDMLSVSDVSRVLNMEPRNVRGLLTTVDVTTRLPGVKIGKSWRIARDQLHRYLVTHHNALHHDNDTHDNAIDHDALHGAARHGGDDVAFSSPHDERDF